ncbi:MAG: hypothetical protein SVY53_09335, partial [Chloroflexota bacterium]|nr:hypothetical protein [Chloroflexota bacterium]
ADTLMQYMKQLINILIGTPGIGAFPAEAAPANGVSLAEVIRAIHADVTGLNGDAMRGTDSAALASVCTEARLSELDAGTAGKAANQIDEIRTDTEDIQTQVGTAGAGLTDLGGMSAGMKAEINAEALDVINTDTFAEPGTGAPPATASIEEKISWLYAYFRNKTTQTSTLLTLRNDGDSADITKATISDDGTTFTKAEFVTG